MALKFGESNHNFTASQREHAISTLSVLLNCRAASKRAYLVQSHWLAHGALDVQATDVLPILLEQRDQEVDGHLGVDIQLLVLHADIADGDSQAQHLLQLELDAGLDLINLSSTLCVRH